MEGIQVVQAGAEVNHAFGNEGFTALYDNAPAAYELPHRRLTRKRFTEHQPPLHLLGTHTSVPPYAWSPIWRLHSCFTRSFYLAILAERAAEHHHAHVLRAKSVY